MKDNSAEEKIYELHSELCGVLAHPQRLKILNLLRAGEKPVKELLEQIKTSKANLSQHLTVLKKAKIVSTRREGLNIYYQLTKPKMIKACDIIREVLFEQISENNLLLKKYKG
ncbi:MAG: metalloregulator ArsR/SmtB family transcription factor [Elusimicrobiota bacterium]